MVADVSPRGQEPEVGRMRASRMWPGERTRAAAATTIVAVVVVVDDGVGGHLEEEPGVERGIDHAEQVRLASTLLRARRFRHLHQIFVRISS